MDNKGTMRILVNRILSFLVGGLLVFVIMSLTVVSDAKKENKALTANLDLSRYEASRLLADAKAEYEVRNYSQANEALNTLFANQPGSPEALEGKTLYVEIEKAIQKADASWEAAMPLVKKQWIAERTTELRAQADMERAKLEASLESQVNEDWENAKATVRAKWEIDG